MNNTEINYPDFVKYVHQHFEMYTSLDEVDKILRLEEGYNKDSPTSLGKSLLLNRLVFSGKKLTGENYRYDQSLYKGFNVWIADNLKGKSTVFKIIKFALTGTDSIKRDIKPWIDEILLEFNIGKVTYTCYVDRTGRDRGGMYRFTIDEFLNLRNNQKQDTITKGVEFEFNSKTQLEEKLESFFFEQFSFYTLKYTKKNSSKEDFELSTAKLSWSTYFKSIYLESSNYEYLFFEDEKYGSQGKKIFEMILGLPLTYPINMLNLQRDRLQESIGRIKLVDKSKAEMSKSERKNIELRFSEVTQKLDELKRNEKLNFDEAPLVEEYGRTQEKSNAARKQQRIAIEAYEQENMKQAPLEEEIKNLELDKRKIDSEINKLKKQELNLELYKQTEGFFTNLEIKSCPHCESEVSQSKKETEQESHICSLCGEKSTQQKVEESEIIEKVKRIQEERAGHVAKQNQIEDTIALQKENLAKLKRTIANCFAEQLEPALLEVDNKRLKEIEIRIDLINRERNRQRELLEKKDELIREEAVLRFQLDEMDKEKSNDAVQELEALNLKKDILDFALTSLEKKRIFLNKNILDKLQKLILNEIQAFGLTNIKQIEINDKYDLVFNQNEVALSFKELNEGEKLRAKLAFYLSLIQLDIEHNLGRHPRFLIFDSPGSEEMVHKHLVGLSKILKNVNDRFKDQLQIFVGSALKEFSQITESDKTLIKEDEEFIF